MTTMLPSHTLLARDEIVAAPVLRACDDRTFELPPVLHVATATLFLGFVGVLSFAFRNPELAVPFGVFVAFIVAFFTVPGLWARMNPAETRTPALGWSEFMEHGIATATGRCGGREAATLVLLLPFLILCWAISVALIAALI
ncbi:hypothetical protein [Sphingomonas sp.]|uniref:hypothetical protein n=1 Tax=Sphingomonas sp. TaxID=28214 RepID=UPI00286D90DA|nr:hypothetical protein [Sphingomonas sp.]